MDEECPICCEPYTKQQRKQVQCAYCQTACCSSCLQQYLLTLQSDAQCMGCKRVLGGEFLSMHLPKTWLLTRYKDHRERVLLDREMALLPASQDMLANYREAKRMETEVHDLETHRRALQAQVGDLNQRIAYLRLQLTNAQQTNYTRRIQATTDQAGSSSVAAQQQRQHRQFIRACPVDGCRGFLSSQWKCGTCESWVCKDCGEPKLGGQHDPEHACDPAIAANHAVLQKDCKPCPQCASMIFKVDGCFGEDTPVRMWDGSVKMSQGIVLGDVLVGDDGTPRHVLDIFGGDDELYRVDQLRGISYVVNSKHTLLFRDEGGPDIEMTVQDYIALPSEYKRSLAAWKCDDRKDETSFTVTPVGRGRYYGWMIDGNKRFVLEDFTVVRNCDQMWCTQCNVAFSWRTGAVVTNGVIHNPHYYEWLRRTRGGVPRNQGDLPCGGLPGAHELDRALRRQGCPKDENLALQNLHRALRHVQHVDLPRLRREAEVDNADLRLQYLLNKIDQEEWKRKLQQREKKRERAFSVMQVYDMFSAAATDTFAALAGHQQTSRAALLELRQLQRFANDSLDAIAKRFNMAAKRLREW